MSEPAPTEAKVVFAQYIAAVEVFLAHCRDAPGQWHSLAKEFSALRDLLLPHAKAGDCDCQYALGSMSYLGLCCDSQTEFEAAREHALEESTHWWIAAAKQGCSWAVDNLIVSGKGSEADRARAVAEEVQRDSAKLIGHDAPTDMPIYGPEFMQEVTRRLYGVVRPEAQ